MHQFGWLSEKGGNFLNLLQKEGVPSKRGGGGGFNPGRNCGCLTKENYRGKYFFSKYIRDNDLLALDVIVI